jgi:hypothetical protein
MPKTNKWKIFRQIQTLFCEAPNLLIRNIKTPSIRSNNSAVNGDRVCLIPQNLIEFWNVATRPLDKNGFWTPAKTDAEISLLESTLTVLPIFKEFIKSGESWF